MQSILLLGFLMGMRHALEADHLAAVASLAAGRRSARGVIRQGAAWGVGHATTLLLLGGACVLLGAAIPERLGHLLELAVGVMLLALGGQILLRLHRQRVHLHVHRHPDGIVHLHAHGHPSGRPHDPALHDHPHPAHPSGRALLVGMLHGLAGSAALLLLVAAAASSPWTGILYIALFGVGSILGMALLSAVIALPLRRAGRGARAGRAPSHALAGLELLVGVATVIVGARIVLESGGALGLFRG